LYVELQLLYVEENNPIKFIPN